MGVGNTFSLSHRYPNSGPYTLAVCVTNDEAEQGCGTVAVTVNYVAPTATCAAQSPVNKGGSFTLSLTNPSDPSPADTTAGFTYAFDFVSRSGYGSFGTATTVSCQAPESGSRTVKGKVKDQEGGKTEYTASVSVNNVNPTATITSITSAAPPVSVPGQTLTFNGSYTDAGVQETQTVGWNFGDSATSSATVAAGGSGSFSTTHAYVNAGMYTVTLTVTDDDGGVGTATTTFVIQTPAAAATALASAVEALPQLSAGKKTSLGSKLDSAAKSAADGQVNAACNQHGSFTNQVKALINSGRLHAATGKSLIESDTAIQQALGCG